MYRRKLCNAPINFDMQNNKATYLTAGDVEVPGATWLDNATILLIDTYCTFEEEMESNRCKKKAVWVKISRTMRDSDCHFSSKQCEQKWRNLMRAYKKVLDNKRQTGGKRHEFAYFNLMDEALGKRHDINPPIRAGNGCAPVGDNTPNIVGDNTEGEAPQAPPQNHSKHHHQKGPARMRWEINSWVC